MSAWGDKCFRCGKLMKLLFTSWYCPCDEDDFSFLGYGLVSTMIYDELDNPNELPKSFCFHIFRAKEIAKEFAEAFIGFTMIQVDLTDEYPVFWSTKDKLWVHEASRNLPCKVVQ